MKTISGAIAGLQKFKASTGKYVVEAFNSNRDAILKLNVSQIYTAGKNRDGIPIKRAGASYQIYTPNYERKKRRLGLYQGHIDLNLTGKYLKSFAMITNDKEILIEGSRFEGNVNIAAVIRHFYPNVEGLSDAAVEQVKQKFILPYLKLKLKECVNG